MKLIIENINNVYELKGSLVKLNIHVFQNKFQNIFDDKSDLTISIVNLERIDNYGVNAIAKLHNDAITKLKRLSIIGFGNQELFNHFKMVETLEIRNEGSENVKETFFKRSHKLYQNYKRKFILPVSS